MPNQTSFMPLGIPRPSHILTCLYQHNTRQLGWPLEMVSFIALLCLHYFSTQTVVHILLNKI